MHNISIALKAITYLQFIAVEFILGVGINHTHVHR